MSSADSVNETRNEGRLNQDVVKKASIFSFLLGMVFGLFALVPPLIGLCLFALPFLSSVIVILYMKKGEKHLAFLNNEQGAILGGIIGFFATVGFFGAFSPVVYILSLFLKSYYTYAIPDMINQAFWLFVVIVFMTGLIFALTNSATAMGTTWLLGYFESKPKDFDAPLEIDIND